MDIISNKEGTPPFAGIYRARVRQRVDPARLQRVKVQVAGIHGEGEDPKLLPWAFPATKSWEEGGFFGVPPLDMMVWVMFEGGDHEYPVYFDGWWSLEKDLGQTAKGKKNSKHTRWPTSFFGSEFPREKGLLRFEKEVPDARPLDSPNNFGYASPENKRFEFDDRNGRQRVVLADQLDNGLYLNSEHASLSLETVVGLRSPNPFLQGLVISSNVKDNKVATQLFNQLGWKATISATDQVLELSSPSGHLFRINEVEDKVEAWTARGRRLILSDRLGRMELRSPGNRGIVIDDNLGAIFMHSPTTGMHLTLNDQNNFAELRSTGDLSLKADGNIFMASGGSIVLDGKVVSANPGISNLQTTLTVNAGETKFRLPSTLPFLKKPYSYNYFKDEEKVVDD